MDSTLFTVHKTRNQLENDTILISNRIGALRREEERMLKKIRETREKAYKLMRTKQDKEKMFEKKLEQELEQEEHLNNKRQQLWHQKKQREQRMAELQKGILNKRRETVNHVRHNSEINDKVFKDIRRSWKDTKKEKAEAIRKEKQRREHKLKLYKQQKLRNNSFDYRNRKNSELMGVKSVERKMSELENVENELMSKLQNTRVNVTQANKEYMIALDNAYNSQESRIETLKKKLEAQRSKYIQPSTGVVRKDSTNRIYSKDSNDRNRTIG